MELSARYGETLSVLIVDDEPEIRELLRSLLEVMGCWNFIVEAESGNQALLKTQNQKFDLVITDLSMPKTSGLDFIRSFRLAEKAKGIKTPLLILSAYLTDEGINRAKAMGVKHILTKPCATEAFIDKVGSILKKEKGEKLKLISGAF